MRVHICAMGRLRAGPEKTLVDDYLTRFDRTGRGLGLGPARVVEVEDKKGGGMAADGSGRREEWRQFAERLGTWRDAGRGDLAFVIGGADGIDPSLRAEADHALSFGKMVWPHMLVRVMLAEQLYRAAAILSGGPYHRV